jgi:hypothetical protein
MGFLDNSGDIIIDAVLTDTGRFRLAKGDGSFRIVKFALGDDEINYESFDKNNASGSAFFDLEILQTPVLEAFTNNAASLKSKLISIPRTNLLYLPVLKLNELPSQNARHSSGAFVVAVDEDTEDSLLAATDKRGILKGARPGGSGQGAGGGSVIRVDQGLDTTEISPAFTIDADLVETQFIVEIDNRFGNIVDESGNRASVSFIDDDNIASYFLSLGTDDAYVSENTERERATGSEAIRGPRGTILNLKIQASIELNTNDFLFEQLGATTTINSVSVKYIDTIIRVTGATTGATIEIPVRFAKQ